MKEKTKVKTMQKQEAIQAIKEQVKGITLIALVVTIIVLLILAGVAISLTIGSNGIFTRAQTAVVINENASVYEQLQLIVVDYQMGNIETGNNTAILDRLKTDGYVNEDNSVNVTKLMGRSMQTGNGSIADGDVYVLEQRQVTATSAVSDTSAGMDYYLIYYDDENVSINLGLAFNSGKATNENAKYFDITPSGSITLKNEYYFYGSGTKNGDIVNIEIPEYIDGIKVTEIGLACFRDCYNLESVTIPDGIVSIDDGAFHGCVKLEEIKFPDSLESIGRDAFWGCTQIEEVTLPLNTKYMEMYAFTNCTSLKKIYVQYTQEEGIPKTWNVLWNMDCDAEIIYKVEE